MLWILNRTTTLCKNKATAIHVNLTDLARHIIGPFMAVV